MVKAHCGKPARCVLLLCDAGPHCFGPVLRWTEVIWARMSARVKPHSEENFPSILSLRLTGLTLFRLVSLWEVP